VLRELDGQGPELEGGVFGEVLGDELRQPGVDTRMPGPEMSSTRFGRGKSTQALPGRPAVESGGLPRGLIRR
jgi:hypothetical protein